MAKDSQGMDLGQVEALVTAAIMIVPYSAENKITPEMIASSNATPELPAAYNRSTACIDSSSPTAATRIRATATTRSSFCRTVTRSCRWRPASRRRSVRPKTTR